ncbi:hypothetical protein KJY73_06445 [Bowmanella sp. Y26]|uniref:hypothetical protein n=1 Tax=Bowmanella yangjiangensis TaxID=2811230 RepID=UPI001BDCA0F2|nr:hypothetical protein [Bowmanella yangjiangensis]MBT1063205.1 hypothetical protein [Bowmanella yangjiangensis]
MDKPFSDWQQDLGLLSLLFILLAAAFEWLWQSNLLARLNLAVLDSLSVAAYPIKEQALWLLPLLGA